MIVIGATPKNSIRRYLARNNVLLAEIKGEPKEPPGTIHENPIKSEIIIHQRDGEKRKIKESNAQPAIIERIVISNPDKESWVFIICAGIIGRETLAAADYLVNNFRELEEQTKGKQQASWCLWFDEKCNLKGAPYFDCDDYPKMTINHMN